MLGAGPGLRRQRDRLLQVVLDRLAAEDRKADSIDDDPRCRLRFMAAIDACLPAPPSADEHHQDFPRLDVVGVCQMPRDGSARFALSPSASGRRIAELALKLQAVVTARTATRNPALILSLFTRKLWGMRISLYVMNLRTPPAANDARETSSHAVLKSCT